MRSNLHLKPNTHAQRTVDIAEWPTDDQPRDADPDRSGDLGMVGCGTGLRQGVLLRFIYLEIL